MAIFEWDEKNAEQNIAKHGTPFEYAARVFLDVFRLDGEVEGRLYVVAYTMRGQIIRLIPHGKPTNAKGGSMIKVYRLDPEKPRQLTSAEKRRPRSSSNLRFALTRTC